MNRKPFYNGDPGDEDHKTDDGKDTGTSEGDSKTPA